MKVQLTDEDLATRGDRNYFAEGEHEVLIEKAERGTTDAGKEYVEFSVLGHADERDTARLWFTTDASAKYAMSIMAGIAVHNKQTDADKTATRNAWKAITETDKIDAKYLANFKDKDAFFTVHKSDRTYTTPSGEVKFSYDKNIYGYMPKPKATTIQQDILAGPSVDPTGTPF